MEDRLPELRRRFLRQVDFARDYSPLYACHCRLVASWLADESDPLAAWLLLASRGRPPFDVTLLLPAALHRELLLGNPVSQPLARYYPSVGGRAACATADFARDLRLVVSRLQDELAAFIQKANVQTNETGRGLVWLLPVAYTGWQSIDLVDLGASAGLNLVAEERNYRLLAAAGGAHLADFGRGKPVQFEVKCQAGGGHDFGRVSGHVPVVASRMGLDVAPFYLKTRSDEATLCAFVWADQVERLRRLREGIQVLRELDARAPVQLVQARLPDELGRFLHAEAPQSQQRPLVVYNTFIMWYLPDNGRALRTIIEEWARSQNRPILWLQWEPPRAGRPAGDPLAPEGESPGYGYCTWTADLWTAGGQHRHWQLGWVHPHGGDVHWGTGLAAWSAFWRDRPLD